MKRPLLIASCAFVVIVGAVIAINWRMLSLFVSGPHLGRVVESWETTDQAFKVRIDQHSEENSFLQGAYYVFRSAPSGTENWRDIMTFRDDDRAPIPQDQIHFVNDHVGFVFMGWMYAVTTDGGANWSVWDANTDLPRWQCCNYRLIEAVHVEASGQGTMTLKPIPGRSGEVPDLHSSDYGRHWNP